MCAMRALKKYFGIWRNIMSAVSEFYDRLYSGQVTNYTFYDRNFNSFSIDSKWYSDIPAVYQLSFDMWSGKMTIQDWFDATNAYSVTGNPVPNSGVCPNLVCPSGFFSNPYKILEGRGGFHISLSLDKYSIEDLSYQPFMPQKSSETLTGLFANLDYTDVYSAILSVFGLLIILSVLIFSFFRFFSLFKEGGRKW